MLKKYLNIIVIILSLFVFSIKSYAMSDPTIYEYINLYAGIDYKKIEVSDHDNKRHPIKYIIFDSYDKYKSKFNWEDGYYSTLNESTLYENSTTGKVRLFFNTETRTLFILSKETIVMKKNLYGAFAQECALKGIYFTNTDFSNTTDMSYMFYEDYDLQAIDFDDFTTSNVVDMSGMFQACYDLISLDLSNFDTSKVENMSLMFYLCEDLKELDVSSFNTSNVTSMYYMFRNCKRLIQLDLKNFDTSKVTNMAYMFTDCILLCDLFINNFDTSKVTNMDYMFSGCRDLMYLDLSSFETVKYVSTYRMFSNMLYTAKIYVSEKWDNNNIVADSEYGEYNVMFDGNYNMVGEKGTMFNEYNVGKAYAKIDGGPTSPGYFHYKPSQTSTDPNGSNTDMEPSEEKKDDPINNEEQEERKTNNKTSLVGDLNNDGKITNIDLIKYIRIITELESVSSYEPYQYDFNSNNDLDVSDMINVIRIILEIDDPRIIDIPE